MPLKTSDWRALFHLNGELADLATAEPLAGMDHLMDALYRLTGSDEGFIMMITRDTPPTTADDPLSGWRPASSMYNRRSAHRARVAADWYSDPSRLLRDPVARRLTGTTGRTRVMLRSAVANDLGHGERLVDTPLLAELGVRHRLTAATPVTQGCEAILGLDRRRGADFGARETALIRSALSGIGWFFRRLPGAADERPALGVHLSPRESETLRALLGGGSENAVARELGVTAATLHQYVKSIYRKLGVRSRAELMARFVRVAGVAPTRAVARHIVAHPGPVPRAAFVAL